MLSESTATYVAESSSPELVQFKRCKTVGVDERLRTLPNELGIDDRVGALPNELAVDGRLSALPNELLSHILSHLTIKEAISTSIVSKKWRYLWTSCPNLDFGCSKTLQQMSKDGYIETISRILKLHVGVNLLNFRIVYESLKEDSSCHIDVWVSFALVNDVSSLELHLDASPFSGRRNNYHLPADVFYGKRALRDLCLRSVNVSDEVFEIILSNCTSLERLLVSGSNLLVNPKNTSPHLRLRSLELYFCDSIKKLELLAPNLASFKFEGGEVTSRCIIHSAQLVELSLPTCMHCEDLNAQFSSFLPKVEYFLISALMFEDLRSFNQLPVFSNLKQVALDALLGSWFIHAYNGASTIMKVAPNLELLELSLQGYGNEMFLQLPSIPVHQKLKELKVFGFSGNYADTAFITYVYEYAISLQKVDITIGLAHRLGDEFSVCSPKKVYEDDVDKLQHYVGWLRRTVGQEIHLS